MYQYYACNGYVDDTMVTNITNGMHVFESGWNIIIEMLPNTFALKYFLSDLAIKCGRIIIVITNVTNVHFFIAFSSTKLRLITSETFFKISCQTLIKGLEDADNKSRECNNHQHVCHQDF